MDAAEIDRIKSNLLRMREQNAPNEHLDGYLKTEGFGSLDAWQKAAGIKPPPGPSFGRRALDTVSDAAEAGFDALNTGVNYAGTQLVKTGTGLLGVPRAASDGVRWVGEKARTPLSAIPFLGPYASVGSKLPSGEEMSKAFFDTTGAPETKLDGVVPGGKIIDSTVQGVMSVPLAGGTGVPALMAGAFGGAGSEIAGQLAEGTKWEVPARIGGALLGAGSGLGTAAAGAKTAKVVNAARKPFTAAGRDQIVGRTLSQLADDPERAIANMDAYTVGQEAFPTPIPGFRLSAAQAAKDDALLAVENTVSNPQGGKLPGFGARVKANNQALIAGLDRLDAGMDPKAFVAELAKQDAGAAMRAQAALDALPAGADATAAGRAIQNALGDRYKALVETRSAKSGPLYRAVEESTTPVPALPLASFVQDTIATTKGEAKATMEAVRKLLFNNDGALDRSAQGMMATRDAIGNLLDNQNLGKHTKSLLLETRRRLDDAMEAIPEARQAREVHAQYSRPLDDFAPDQGNRTVGKVIERDGFDKTYLMDPERVPAQFFRPGDGGGAAMKEFLSANSGNTAAVDAMRNFIAGKAREAKDVKGFLQQNRAAIDALDPGLARQIEDLATTRGLQTGFRSSPAGKFLDGDLDAAVRSTLGAPDATRRMQSLRMSVGNSPEAVRGLQKAILDDFRSKALASVAEDGAENGMLLASKSADWLKQNRGSVVNVLTPEQVAGLEAITKALKDQAQAAVRTKGSDTGRNLATQSLLEAMLGRHADAAWLEIIRKPLNFALDGGNRLAAERLSEALMDPRVASALMKKATPANAKLAEPVLRRLGQDTGRATALPAATSDERGSR